MKYVYSFGEGKAEGDSKRKDLLGGKGAGLAEMTSLGLPVPPGFTISTEACTVFSQTRKMPAELGPAVDEALARLEKNVGMRFGDPSAPLLVSVRSGARASMPGMMDTILNLGLNEKTCEGLAKRTNNPRFALDAYRRFIAMYSDVALGVKRDNFEHALDEARARVAKAKGIDGTRLNGEELRRKVTDADITEDELRNVVVAFKKIVKEKTGKDFPEDPKEQLWGAIGAVFESWNNHRAIVYRRMHDIPDSWGTACNVQAMVFGNMGDTSATGVAFTRDPSTGERLLYGEWLPNAQGEDVVAGIRTPLPILAANVKPGHTDSLEQKMPEAFKTLVSIGQKLEKHFRDMQDLEFTIQDGKLYMLQCRNAKRTGKAAVRVAVEMVKEGLIDKEEAVLRVDPASLDQLLHPTLDPTAPKTLLAKGLSASPGAAQGKIVFSADEAEKRANAGEAVILVRVETSPEDIHGMKAARGILTARGGMTSHAAVVARGMGKPCVAGCSALAVNYQEQTVIVTQYDEGGRPQGSVTLKRGDVITIDGGAGHVYQGAVPTVNASLTGEFSELMAWADEARKMKVRANADTPLDARTARGFGAEGIGLCRTEHMFFDEERIRAMREMILADDVAAREKALAKILPHQRQDFVEIFREMKGFPVTIRLLDPPLHEFLPTEKAHIEELAKLMNVSVARLEQRIKDLHEFNPMLGHRGCRLAITYPEIYAMQVRAILEAAAAVTAEGNSVTPEIMIPLAMTREELVRMRQIVDKVSAEVSAKGTPVSFAFGTMIELPRAAVRANELAEVAEFFSFGTNDLTQCTMGLSRDDAGKFLPAYVEGGILPKDPFVSIDIDGVGSLVKVAVERGRATKSNIKLGVCGEHGGDPESVKFFHGAGLDYVSCSPFRVTIARLAAAQAEVAAKKGRAGSTTA
ncbi:pyruvate, phosphate dikinase [Labilithrix luteola]|nr:pyruvate, phosphate dikinase [Labilithrix luteola]